MKLYRPILPVLSAHLLAAGALCAAAPAEPAAPPATPAGEMPEEYKKPLTPEEKATAARAAAMMAKALIPTAPPMTIGIPTPMEEYGLTIGDITVSRVFNPLGQLAVHKHLLLSRQLTSVTNPWEELAPGTAVVVDGRKAVVTQIEPAEAPKDTGVPNLRVVVRAQEIGGPEITLTWQQELQTLNQRVEAQERRRIVGRVKRELRVGSHLIVEGNRAIITSLKLTAEAGAALEANPPHTLNVRYSGISSPHGLLTARENRAESRSEPTWRFLHQPARGGADARPMAMADGSVRMITWNFVRRTINGEPDPEGTEPNVLIIHRRRGLITQIEAPVDNPNLARVQAQFSFDGRVLTRSFEWNLTRTVTRKVLWQLKPHASETYVQMYVVNDPNIRFKVTPRSLIDANEKARKSMLLNGGGDAGQMQLGHFANFNTNSVEQQLQILDRIFKSDASKVVKLDEKRKAVIKLAQDYELKAIHHRSLVNEQFLRAEMEVAEARRLEINAWANARKAKHLRALLPAADLPGLEQGAETADLKDLLLPLASIAEADRDVAEYIQSTPNQSASDQAQDYSSFYRRAKVQKERAQTLRAMALERREDRSDHQAEATKFFLHSIKMWQEYILRTEGLQKEERSLVERGHVKSPLPPDQLIPEILLRQGWIYRELGMPHEAVNKFFDVLSSSLQQKTDNLVRMKRINIVAQSQVANAYYEAPLSLEDRTEAIKQLRNIMVQPEGQRIEDHELDITQIQLRHMRALYNTIRMIDSKLTHHQRRLKNVADGTLAKDRMRSTITRLAKDRNEHWRELADYAARFIEQYTETQTRQSVRYDGEVRYYKILAHQALGNEQHVEREVEVLLQNSSVTSALEQVWADTRLQIVMDMANLLYAEAIQLQAEQERLAGKDSGSPVHTGSEDRRAQLQVEVQKHLSAAITYYQWALSRDQSYRSQIFLRQQLAFAHERLGLKHKALEYCNQILSLFELHPPDVSPVLTFVRNNTLMRQNNLRIELEQINKTP